MDCDQALQIVDVLVWEKKGVRLNDLQRSLLRSLWNSQRSSYRQIAQVCGYSESYLKYDVGPELWRLLSDLLQEKVNKTNLRSALERQWRLTTPTPASEPEAEQPAMPAVVDWGEAIDISGFYGRQQDLRRLTAWIIKDSPCRLVALLGMGGLGKSALSVKLARELQPHFNYVIWRSLRQAPPLSDLLADLLQVLGQPTHQPGCQAQISSLLAQLKTHRCLIVLDNVETILAEGTPCRYRPGYEAYGACFQALGEVPSRSTVMLTSREKPREIARLEGPQLPVRSHCLSGLNPPEAQLLLAQKGNFSGSPQDWAALTQRYGGNPLALKIVATTIANLFEGSVAAFLQEEVVVFGDIRNLLAQQCDRLSPLEETLIYGLALHQAPLTLQDLRAYLIDGVTTNQLLEALESLHRRSLLERNQARFTLQPVVVDYLLTRLIDRIYQEIEQQSPQLLRTHTLIQATAKDHVRQTQIRLILRPLLQRLQVTRSPEEIVQQGQQLLRSQQHQSATAVGYTAGNVINLLCHCGVSLRGLDGSHLVIRQADLQGVPLPEATFEGSQFHQCVFTQQLGNVLALAFSSDGRHFATGTADGRVTLWQSESNQPLQTLAGHAGRVWTLAFSPDGGYLASGGDDHSVRLWSLPTGEWECLDSHQDWVFTVAFSADGQWLASGGSDGVVRLWSLSAGHRPSPAPLELRGHHQAVRAVSFNPNQTPNQHPNQAILASAGDDHTVRLWDVPTGRLLRQLHGHHQRIDALAFSPDGKQLASGSCDRTLRLWDIVTGHCLGTLKGHGNWILAVAFDPSGERLASCGSDHAIKLWQLKDGSHQTLNGHVNRVCALAFSPDGQTLISGGNDHAVKFWQVASGQCYRTLKGHASRVHGVSFSPNGQLLASAHSDQTIRLWQVATGRCHQVLRGHTNWVWCIAFSPDGQVLASGSDDQLRSPWWAIRLWDLATGDCIRVLSGHHSWVQSIAFSPNGQTLASGSCDHTLRLWAIDTGHSRPLTGHQGRIWCVAFSPDGQTLASSSDDATVRLWDVATGRCQQVYRGHQGWVQTVSFSPDGQWLASGSSDHTIRLWHLPSGTNPLVCRGHQGWVRSLTFSPAGQTLASGSSDQTVRLWDWPAERCRQVLQGHHNWVRSVAFAPDGKHLASGSQDETIGLWRLPTGELKRLRPEQLYTNMKISRAVNLSPLQRAALIDQGAMET